MLGIVKEVCDDFNWSQNVQLSSSQKFDLTREHLGSACYGMKPLQGREKQWGRDVEMLFG